ncbi:hypothetical protein [Paenibacillus alvei]|nr:hypothetical protein [Paenibacillus alvei]
MAKLEQVVAEEVENKATSTGSRKRSYFYCPGLRSIRTAYG